MDNPFRSERLVYRAIEDTPEDDNFLHSICSDGVTMGPSSASLLAPMNMKKTKGFLKEYLAEKALLGVLVCLPPPPAAAAPAAPEGAAAETTTPPPAPAKPTPVGFIALSALPPDRAHHRDSSMGLIIAPAHQRRGYGTEAIRWAARWGFSRAGLHRISIEAFSYNEGAVRLYGRLGFVREGRRREALWHDGGWHDVVAFSMLEHEWREQQRLGTGVAAGDLVVVRGEEGKGKGGAA